MNIEGSGFLDANSKEMWLQLLIKKYVWNVLLFSMKYYTEACQTLRYILILVRHTLVKTIAKLFEN